MDIKKSSREACQRVCVCVCVWIGATWYKYCHKQTHRKDKIRVNKIDAEDRGRRNKGDLCIVTNMTCRFDTFSEREIERVRAAEVMELLNEEKGAAVKKKNRPRH